MKKLSSDFTGFAKKGFPLIWFTVFGVFVILSVKGGMFDLLLPLWVLFFVGFVVRFIIMWKTVVDFYVDYGKNQIFLDDLMGKKYQYNFSQLETVNYKRSGTRRVKVTFSDKKSFVFLTKDLWLFELATDDGRSQNIKEEIRKIQLMKHQA